MKLLDLSSVIFHLK